MKTKAVDPVPKTLLAVVGAALLAVVAVELVHRTLVRLGRRYMLLAELTSHAHRAFQVFCVLLAARTALQVSPARFDVRHGVLHVMGIAVIVAGAWLLATALLALEDVAEARFRIDVPDNREARRIRTQIEMLRRVTIAAVVIVALGLILMTFPQVRAIGTSLLASAGIIGIVTALAAQSVLGNVIAGLQLAFSDAIRIDDVVVVENEWARIEEITLTHVVLHIWDDRRLILPTSYFTSRPYQNWTRTRSELLGTVELDVDWDTPVPELRDELRRFVEANDLWDGRVCVLQVTDAIQGRIRLRGLVSAGDAPSLWDLRCIVREHMVAWVRENRPNAMPRTRLEIGSRTRSRPTQMPEDSEGARVFSGSEDGEARGEAFHGPERPLHETILSEQARLDEP
ncbi:mechanosensitive ion channel family protein [Allorhizocola rhizosphaerae]|uniref:mechanosensitive ion channel family protein n=1 Tax=Allorhizocola rhizosphaerae TaxID=1872709 RepID=UPI001FE84435|nr:mechanosensitive ion channel domain-containing protein [Allorhizocola rhizosphaerae]